MEDYVSRFQVIVNDFVLEIVEIVEGTKYLFDVDFGFLLFEDTMLFHVS